MREDDYRHGAIRDLARAGRRGGGLFTGGKRGDGRADLGRDGDTDRGRMRRTHPAKGCRISSRFEGLVFAWPGAPVLKQKTLDPPRGEGLDRLMKLRRPAADQIRVTVFSGA